MGLMGIMSQMSPMGLIGKPGHCDYIYSFITTLLTPLLLLSLLQIINNGYRQLCRHEEALGILAELTAAHGAGILGVMRNAVAEADYALNAPPLAGQHPAVAVDNANGSEVALETLRLQVGENAERQLHASCVIM